MSDQKELESEASFPLLFAIGEIDSIYIKECIKPRKSKQLFTKLATYAAIFVLCVTAVITVFYFSMIGGNFDFSDLNAAPGDKAPGFSTEDGSESQGNQSNSGVSTGSPSLLTTFGVIVLSDSFPEDIMKDFTAGGTVILEYGVLTRDMDENITLYIYRTDSAHVTNEDNSDAAIIATPHGEHTKLTVTNLGTGAIFSIKTENGDFYLKLAAIPNSDRCEISISKGI